MMGKTLTSYQAVTKVCFCVSRRLVEQHTVRSFGGMEVYVRPLLALAADGHNLEAVVLGCRDSGDVLTLG
jgi:hypothetical protein